MSAAEGRVGVTELYASIQGESTHMGRPCTFIRLAGCPLRCRWCDTEYSFEAGTRMAIEAVVEAVQALGVPLVEVTGGEPLSQRGCRPLMAALADAGFEVLLETSGSVDMTNIDPRVTVIADLKCPGSNESKRNLWPQLAKLRAQDELKIVVADEADFQWALKRLDEQLEGVAATVLWSAVHGELKETQLASLIMASRAPGRMQIQLHKVLWPDTDRGV